MLPNIHRRSTCVLKRIAVIALVLFVPPAYAANDPLQLFKNYFVTGDYASNGVGLRGKGTLDPITGQSLAVGTITVPVPSNAEIVAAFLYWETIEKTSLPSSAKGYVSYPWNQNARIEILGKPLGAEHAAPCWSSGGSTGASNGAPTLRVYRADVLRYLDLDITTKKKLPTIVAMLPDSGSNGSTVPLTEGASLVVVYRAPSMPFKGIVIFDGSFTMNNSTDSLNQTLYGFYQASSSKPAAKMTHIVGDGQANFPERLWFNGNQIVKPSPAPFSGSNGASWDDLTFDVSSWMSGNDFVATTVVDHGTGSFDCLSWGAILFSTTVQDTDEDGLLDIWETSGLRDPKNPQKGNLLVSLPDANPNHKDIYIEVDYMKELVNDALSPKGVHSHKLTRTAIDLVGDAFKNAPLGNPDGVTGINAHFDVQNPNTPTGERYPNDPYIVSVNFGEGGDIVNERSGATFCTTLSQQSCLFPSQPGLVSWKKGLQHIKQAHVPGLTKFYFNTNRNFIYHYVLAGHGSAVHDATLSVPPFSAVSVSGRADLCGRDVVLSLGLWRSATDVTVASTLLHELAHNMCGYHGGTPDGLNCKPNHQSVLNYMYQAAGVTNRFGKVVVDLSRENLAAPASSSGDEILLNEADGLGMGTTAYQLRWYAPRDNVEKFLGLNNPSAPAQHVLTAAKAHCDGSRIGPFETPMLRVDGIGVAAQPIDWNYNGLTNEKSSGDINFNGKTDQLPGNFRGFNDWQSIGQNRGLQQIGTGRNLFGLSLLVQSNDLLRLGEADLGEADLGEADLGEADLGEADLGEADLGEADLGEADLGSKGLGEADLGALSELDEPTAAAVGAAPSGLSATVQNGSTKGVLLSWNSPALGIVTQYTIYRSTGASIAQPLTVFGPLSATTTNFLDAGVKNNVTYTYYVLATLDDGTVTGPSNFVTILNR